MRTPKLVDTFITSINEMLTSGQLALLESQPAFLKLMNYILGELAPGYSILSMHDVEGNLAGFASKFTPTTSNAQIAQHPLPAHPDDE